jgi:hypothetical protein
METDYNFWADLLTTYRSNPDWLKFLWVFVPAALLTLAGCGLSRLVRVAVEAKTHQQPRAFRSWQDKNGKVYFEPLDELPTAIPSPPATTSPPPPPLVEDREF